MTTNANAQKMMNPAGLFDPAPFGFSHLAIVPARHQLVFVAGQGGEKDTTGTLDNDFRKQVRQLLNNIATALKAAGLTLNQVVKVTTLVVDHDTVKLQILVEEFKRTWPSQQFPVNTLIPVPRLALDNMLVEIDAVAIHKKE